MNEEQAVYLNQFMPRQFKGRIGDVAITANVMGVELKSSVFGDKIVIHILEIAGVDVRDGEPMLFTPHHVQNGVAVRCSTYYVEQSKYNQEMKTLLIPSAQNEVVCHAE